MKKSLCLAGVILLLLCTGLGMAVRQVDEEKDDIVITQQVLEGDVRAADGVTFRIGTQWKGRMNWDTSVTIDGNSTDGVVASKTDYEATWQKEEKKRSYTWTTEVMEAYYTEGYHTSIVGGWSDSVAFSGVTFAAAVEAVASRTAPGESHEEIIQLNDYHTYYPLFVELHLGESMIWGINAEEFLSSYLQIRIPDSHQMKISITRNNEGNIIGIGSDSTEGSPEIHFSAAEADDGVYFAYYGVADGIFTDLDSQHGNGIYFLPFVRQEDGIEMQHDKLEKIFDLPEKDCYVVELKLDREEKQLLVLTKESDSLVFRSLAFENWEEKQQIMLMAYESNDGCQVTEFIEENLLIVLGNGSLCFLTVDENGKYQNQIVGSLGVGNSLRSTQEWDYDVDYRDGRLALICAENYWVKSVYVYIFGEAGLEYKGYYEHSADYENRDVGLENQLWGEDSLRIKLP